MVIKVREAGEEGVTESVDWVARKGILSISDTCE